MKCLQLFIAKVAMKLRVCPISGPKIWPFEIMGTRKIVLNYWNINLLLHKYFLFMYFSCIHGHNIFLKWFIVEIWHRRDKYPITAVGTGKEILPCCFHCQVQLVCHTAVGSRQYFICLATGSSQMHLPLYCSFKIYDH